MGYASYEFYKNEYHGDAIAESDFPKWIDRAGRQMDIFTRRRLLVSYPADEYADMQIKLCACEFAENMQEIYRYASASSLDAEGKPKLIKSVSAGSESISYATTESAYASYASDIAKANKLYRSIIIRYLTGICDAKGICLLYAGD